MKNKWLWIIIAVMMLFVAPGAWGIAEGWQKEKNKTVVEDSTGGWFNHENAL